MNVVRLQVHSKYRSRQVEYQAGTVIEVTEVEADFLLRDAPGCFAIAPDVPRADEPPATDEPPAPASETPPEGKAPRRPPADKMVKDEDTERK